MPSPRMTLPIALALALLVPARIPGKAQAEASPAPPKAKGTHTDRYGDPLPEGAITRLGTARWRYFNAMRRITFSPGGRLILARSQGVASLWEVETGRRVHTFGEESHQRFPCSATFTPDGNTLVSVASGPEDESLIRFWDVHSGVERRRLPAGKELVTALTVSWDGKMLASGGEHGTIRLWDVRTGQKKKTITGYRKRVQALAFGTDGKTITALDSDGKVDLLDVTTGALRQCFTVRYTSSPAVLSPDGRTVARSGEHAVWLWEVATGEERRLLKVRVGFCRVTFAPDGKRLVSVENTEGEVGIWDVRSGERLRSLKIPQCKADGCSDLALSPDGQTLATAEDNSRLHLWNTTTGRELFASSDPSQPAEVLAYTPDGKILNAVVAWDGVYRWDVASGRLLSRTALPIRGTIQVLQFSPDGNRGAIAHGRGIVLWDLDTGGGVRRLRGHAGRVNGVAFSPSGTRLASGAEDGTIRLWEVASGKPVRVLEVGRWAKTVTWVAFSPDGQTLAAGDGPLRVHLWNTAAGEHLGVIQGDPAKWEEAFDPMGWHCRFSPDAKTLMAADSSNCLVWDLASRAEVSPFRCSEVGYYLPTVLSPDGRLLARFDGLPCTLWLWEMSTGERVHRFSIDSYSVAFAPDGRTVATACHDDSSVLVWDLKRLFGAASPGRGGGQASPWEELASADVARAYRAMGRLMGDGEAAIALLEKSLRPVPRPTTARVEALVKDLECTTFAERQKAQRRLEEMREGVRPVLERIKKGTVPLETRRRVEELLERLHPRSPDRLREVRGVHILEYLGTPAARRLLGSLAEGAPEARLTQEARASVRRLSDHRSAKP